MHQTDRVRSVAGNYTLAAVLILFALGGLDAYSIGAVPLQWVSQAGLVFFTIALSAAGSSLLGAPNVRWMGWFLAWCVGLNLVYANSFEGNMPSLATLPYRPYVALRYMSVLAFLSAYCLVYRLLQQGYEDALIKAITVIGLVVAVFAFYVYAAQLLGLPEPARTRLGTSGGEQATTFTYAFHRALGSFREPSHLAEYLLLPLIWSLARRARDTFVLSLAFIATGSLAGIASLCGGLAVAILVTRGKAFRVAKPLLTIVGTMAMGLFIFQYVIGGSGADARILDVISGRVAPILAEGGMMNSNRDYIYEFIADNPMPLVGVGLGNANIRLSEAMGNPLTVSFLSVYFMVIYSAGILGFTCVAAFLLGPLKSAWRRRDEGVASRLTLGVAAYVAYLIAAGVRSEEMSINLGIAAAFLIYHSQRQQAGSTLSQAPDELSMESLAQA